MKIYDSKKPEFGRLARYKKDYQRWWMAYYARAYAGQCAEVSWRIRRIGEAKELELALTLEWLVAAGKIKR